MSRFFCLYQPHRCHECGRELGSSAIDGRFCSLECADSQAEALTRIEESDHRRRQAEDDFAAEVDRLSAAGYSYAEIDTILEDMP
jgi:hypothetical protein